ncbi:MAG: ribonuclease HII [Alphaproteobacteria bacterium]|nr:ribonuclease HII [Alphaproteobacteria bacterium]
MPDFSIEKSLALTPIAGVDEAGRGPWAGPVVAAAVILDPARVPAGLDDSKRLQRPVRERLYGELSGVARLGVGQASVAEIDALNILQASLLAMRRAVEALATPPALALIDGNRRPQLPCPSHLVVGGDGKSLSIAAASIVAKVTRDRIMADLAMAFPGYGWERNAGYGTQMHRRALNQLGITPHHRRTFAPIRNMLILQDS